MKLSKSIALRIATVQLVTGLVEGGGVGRGLKVKESRRWGGGKLVSNSNGNGQN